LLTIADTKSGMLWAFSNFDGARKYEQRANVRKFGICAEGLERFQLQAKTASI
jgi:hypothetical protein